MSPVLYEHPALMRCTHRRKEVRAREWNSWVVVCLVFGDIHGVVLSRETQEITVLLK